MLERKLALASSPGPGALSDSTVREFARRLAARTPTPGGGAAAGAAGAFGVALGEMVFAYSDPADSPSAELAPVRVTLSTARERLLALAQEDCDAYEAAREARRAKRSNPADPKALEAYSRALRRSADVPLETARVAESARRLILAHQGRVKAVMMSDFTSALELLRAAREGAAANVRINLTDLREAGVATGDWESGLASLAPPP
ncbi:MAG: cyclodeaminase/cyclohydrolase family protein [Thermoplasmata archaeon]|nr:cyclodeaminase/cyclohydrolase family protein [Thermoplasmata archaeon]